MVWMISSISITLLINYSNQEDSEHSQCSSSLGHGGTCRNSHVYPRCGTQIYQGSEKHERRCRLSVCRLSAERNPQLHADRLLGSSSSMFLFLLFGIPFLTGSRSMSSNSVIPTFSSYKPSISASLLSTLPITSQDLLPSLNSAMKPTRSLPMLSG